MPKIEINQEDHCFLISRAEAFGISIEELMESLIAKERVLSKPREDSPFPTEKPKIPIEPPHRKWGM